jgi:hypothetical protein
MTAQRPASLDGLLDFVASRLPAEEPAQSGERIPLDIPECSATCRCRVVGKETGK